jgi:uncharacterized protein YgbK (DUF1537 family)
MIIVFADDFSGAAEMAGIGLRYGLRTEIHTDKIIPVKTDLLVIDSSTRLASEKEAGHKIDKLAMQLKGIDFDWLYKKTDSVLRGHILTELKSLMINFGRPDVLLVPQNPGIGRVIRQGKYFINNIPLDETEFAEDPDFPRQSSEVLKLMGEPDGSGVNLLDVHQKNQLKGITIGSATSENDLELWAKYLTPEIMPAGGSEFFRAILNAKGMVPKSFVSAQYFDAGKRILIIRGSTSKSGEILIRNWEKKKIGICNIPCAVSKLNQNYVRSWQDSIKNAFKKTNMVVLTIDQQIERVPDSVGSLSDVLASITSEVLHTVPLDELFIEGGDTASGILRLLGWNRFYPVEEWDLGVVRMKISDDPSIHLTTKPGSYPWPEKIFI